MGDHTFSQETLALNAHLGLPPLDGRCSHCRDREQGRRAGPAPRQPWEPKGTKTVGGALRALLVEIDSMKAPRRRAINTLELVAQLRDIASLDD